MHRGGGRGGGGRGRYARVLVVRDVQPGPDLSVGAARACAGGPGPDAEEVEEAVRLDRLLDVSLRCPERRRVLAKVKVAVLAERAT